MMGADDVEHDQKKVLKLKSAQLQPKPSKASRKGEASHLSA